jgi:hypothetical protein
MTSTSMLLLLLLASMPQVIAPKPSACVQHQHQLCRE